MADKKISALASASLPLAGTEVLPLVQSGATVNVAINALAAGNVKSQSTTGVLQIAGPAAGATRVATVPDANWTAARTDAAQSFTGDQTLSTGNLGVGTALSAWSNDGKVLELPNGVSLFGNTGSAASYLFTNAYFNGSNFIYKTTRAASYYNQQNGVHSWNTAPSGTAGDPITFTERMNLDLSGNLKLNTGNLTPSTAAKGVNFTANTPAAGMTSQLLNWYEEGTFTPVPTCSGQTITTSTASGTYTRIGRMVTAQCAIIINTVSGAAGGATTITGLPFANGGPGYSGQGSFGYNDGFAQTVSGTWISGTTIYFRNGARSQGNDANGFSAGGYINLVVVYFV